MANPNWKDAPSWAGYLLNHKDLTINSCWAENFEESSRAVFIGENKHEFCLEKKHWYFEEQRPSSEIIFDQTLGKEGKFVFPNQVTSDGSTASYYELPASATELQHLISAKDMNAQIGEIFRATYRYGQCSHSDKLRDAKKIKFYIVAEIERLEALQNEQ